MKTRTGYVSNSSSSSFVFGVGFKKNDDENNLIQTINDVDEIDDETMKELENTNPFSIFENTEEIEDNKNENP